MAEGVFNRAWWITLAISNKAPHKCEARLPGLLCLQQFTRCIFTSDTR